MDLRRLFNPQSIALVGASDRSAWSLNTLVNLQRSTARPRIHLVNPRQEVVHGLPAVPSLSDVPDRVDLAYVMVPTEHVLGVLEEGSSIGIKDFVILTSGFGETGNAGRELEQKIVDYAHDHELTVIGPNGNGFINAAAGVFPYGLPIPDIPKPGSVSFVLQSGALVSSVYALVRARNMGTSLICAMGNESMVSVNDVLDYLIDDPNTAVIALFLETVRSPSEFRGLAQRALSVGKPIVALKIGRSAEAGRVARAHTGAMVGDDAVVDAVFAQDGVVRVRSLEDLVMTAGLLAAVGPLSGPRIGFVTPSGGSAAIIADRAADEGISLPPFQEDTRSRLEAVLPPYATVNNPLDLTGYVVVDPSLFSQAISIVGDDDGLDAAVLLWELPRADPPDPERSLQKYGAAADSARKAKIPVIAMGSTHTDVTAFSRRIQDETDYPYYLGGIDHGMTALGAAVAWSAACRRNQEAGPRDRSRMPSVNVSAAKRGVWNERTTLRFLADNGVPTVPTIEARSPSAAAEAASTLGFPVVVKADADDLAHKSEIGGVRLAITSPAEASEAFVSITDSARRAGVDLRGVLVQPQRSDGIELLVGVTRDAQWGHVLSVGLGGVWVEIVKDVSLRVLPVTPTDVRHAFEELRAIEVLRGARNTSPVDLDRLVGIVDRIAQIASGLGDALETLEVNPLFVDGDRIEALDGLAVWL